MPHPEVQISVIVPAYNYAHLLPRALDSVLGQWRDGLELIVVNDGSTDGTLQVLGDYAARYPQVQVVDQANGGAASARNHGIRLAQGRHVLLLDADDELLPTALASLSAALAETPDAGIVLAAYVSVYPDGSERVRKPTPVPALSARELISRYLLKKTLSVSHSCTLFRRDLLLQRPYPEMLSTGEDIPVFAYLLVSAPVALTADPVARIYKHAGSLRHRRDNEEAFAMDVAREAFAQLPADCQPLRRRFEAQSYLSLFRGALLAQDSAAARRFYLRAWQLSPGQAMRWTYVRKVLRLLVKS
ncbi:glycosyltransferase family 2 protein [Pseudomonas abieticivorans]|uniref:glycosyltransferase family 2 protein n=1 Tax=Pseudomonas abieticivorans TaxID=2931382 RepID=UPI0020C0BD93|nr:glycosyltransferase family 2 protein [Pseudomonas sp. PIA16]